MRRARTLTVLLLAGITVASTAAAASSYRWVCYHTSHGGTGSGPCTDYDSARAAVEQHNAAGHNAVSMACD